MEKVNVWSMLFCVLFVLGWTRTNADDKEIPVVMESVESSYLCK